MKTFFAQLSLNYCLQFSDDDPFMIELTLPSLLRIEDPNERASLEAQILEFGQTPKQLFTSPHPQKLVKFYQSHVRVNCSKKHHVSFSSIYIQNAQPSLSSLAMSIDKLKSEVFSMFPGHLSMLAQRVWSCCKYTWSNWPNTSYLSTPPFPPRLIASTLHQVNSFREKLGLHNENHPSRKSPTMKTEITCFTKSLRR